MRHRENHACGTLGLASPQQGRVVRRGYGVLRDPGANNYPEIGGSFPAVA